MKVSARQLGILQHALGLDEYGRGTIHRNFFCAGSDDAATCRDLVAMGLMQRDVTAEIYPYFNCSVTNAGKNAIRENSPVPPKLCREPESPRDNHASPVGV